MKIIPLLLAGQYSGHTSSLCRCLHILRSDGYEAGITNLDRELVIDGLTYRPGLDLSDIVSSSGLSVDNLDLTILVDPVTDPTLEDDLRARRWNGAAFEIFEVNWRDLSAGRVALKSGSTGEVSFSNGEYTIEFRGLAQALQQTVGISTSRTCRAAFADYPQPNGSNRCRLDPADFLVTGEVTDLTDQLTFKDTGRTEADDWFGEGLLTFMDGPNQGWTEKIKVYAADGTFTLYQPAPFTIEVGDAYKVIAGCRKRLTEDCIGKYQNVLNFAGEPHLPGVDLITGDPDADAGN